jgi:hypothetical protein
MLYFCMHNRVSAGAASILPELKQSLLVLNIGKVRTKNADTFMALRNAERAPWLVYNLYINRNMLTRQKLMLLCVALSTVLVTWTQASLAESRAEVASSSNKILKKNRTKILLYCENSFSAQNRMFTRLYIFQVYTVLYLNM